MTTLHFRKLIGWSPLRLGFLLVPLAIACFALSPRAQAVSPPPDGGYPGLNTAEGQNALFSLTTGSANTAVGWFSLWSNAEGSFNTATGAGALLFNTADENTAFGAASLLLNTIGFNNTAVGAVALLNNTEGIENTATGSSSLYSNTTGSSNTANGAFALFNNSTGNGNTANGNHALVSNTTGFNNTADGYQALFSNTTGIFNTATGYNALVSNTIGGGNTADGEAALFHLTTGGLNTAIGTNVLFNISTANLNIALGESAGDFITGDNNIDIGNLGVAADANTIRIGMEVGAMDEFGVLHPAHTATYIAGISGQTASGGVAVYINSDGKLGTLTSSARFKTEIKPMDESSKAILALKPVTFRYKHEIDPKDIPQFGLVAEEVEKVNPDLVVRNRNGEIYSVRYEAVNAMLLNEFLKEHREVQQQKTIIAQLKSTVESQQAASAQQQKQIEVLTAGLEKVSAQVEMSRPAPQMVKNP